MSGSLTNLNDYVEVVMGQAPPGDECNKNGEGTVFVKAGEFQARTPVAREWTTKPLKMAQPNDSLVCVVGATAGKVNLASFDCAIGRSVAAVRPKHNKIDPLFLYQFLQTRVEQLRDRSQGAAQGVITREMLLGLSLAVPPLTEQRRIAAILDQAETLRTQRRTALALLDSLTQSLFLDMFGDPVTNDRGWPDSLALGEVADIASGVTKGRKLDGKATREVPYLAVANVQDKALRLEGLKTIEATEDEISRYRLQKDDLLLTEGGDPDKLGRGTLWNEELSECIHQNHIFRVRLTHAALHPLFLNWLVGSTRGKNYFLRSAKQTTGIASINMTQLRSFPLLVPPLPLQQTFATRIASIEALKATHRRALAALDALFASLQQRAFSGELTLAAPRSLAQSLKQLQQLEASIGQEALIFIAKRMPNGDLYNSLKAIYFADRHHLEHHGRQIYNETYSALTHGPVPQAAYDATNVLIGKLMFSSFDDDAVRAALRRKGDTLTALRDADFSKLSRAVIESLEWGIRYCRDMKFGQTKTASHDSAYERTPKNEAIPLQYVIDTLPPEARQRHWGL